MTKKDMLVHDGILLQLMQIGAITSEQIQRFLHDNRISEHDHITVVTLLYHGRITDEQVALCMAIRAKMGYVNLRHISPLPGDIALITSGVANFLRIVPFKTHIGTLTVAMEDPSEERIIESARYFFDDTPIAISTRSGMDYALRKYYPTTGFRIPPPELMELKNIKEAQRQAHLQLN